MQLLRLIAQCRTALYARLCLKISYKSEANEEYFTCFKILQNFFSSLVSFFVISSTGILMVAGRRQCAALIETCETPEIDKRRLHLAAACKLVVNAFEHIKLEY